MLGETIFGFFEAIGFLGLLIAFAVISFFDGLAIPTLPEAWLILIAMTDVGISQIVWGTVLVVIGTLSAISAQLLLFLIIKKMGLPNRIRKVMNKYTDFLIVSDEKLAFMNWLAPVIPFTGAFIAVCNWRPKLAFTYSFFGGLTKMSALVIVASAFRLSFSAETAANASLILVAVVLAASLSITYLKRKKMLRYKDKLPDENQTEKKCD